MLAGSARLELRFRRDRNRLATLAQPLLGLPQYLVLALATVPLGLVLVYAWLALLVTAHWPPSPYRWTVGWLRAAIRNWAYLNLVSGEHPPWTLDDDPGYEVRLLVGSPKPRYGRLKVLFRFIFVLPAYLAGAVGGLLLYALLIVSWLRILAASHQSEEIFRLQVRGLTWFTLYGLLVDLVIEDYDWSLSAPPPPS